MQTVVRSFFLALLATFFPCSASATLFVDWGGDYTTGGIVGSNTGTTTSMADLDGQADLGDSRRLVPYSESTARRLAGQGSSSRFYGGMDVFEFDKTVAGVPDHDDWEIENNAAVDRISLRIQPANSSYGETYGVYVWLQADNLNSLETGNIELNSLSISLLDNAYTLRWLVKKGASDFFLSNDTITGGSKTVTLSDASATTWAAYDPASNLKFTPGTFDALDMNEITGVGVYYQQLNQPNSGQRMRITGFEADGQIYVVPEPGAFALVLLGLGAALLRRRRN